MTFTLSNVPRDPQQTRDQYRHGDSNPGTVPRELRNCSLVQPTHLTHTRISLPLVRPPYEWHEDHHLDIRGRRRSACTIPGYRKGQAPPNKGKTYHPSPPTPEEVYAILDQLWWPGYNDPKHGPIGLRNRALVTMLWRPALRIFEVLALKPGDVDFEHGQVEIHHGKGDKHAWVFVDQWTRAELNAWLHVRALMGFGLEEPMFPVLEGSTRGAQMSQPYVRTKLKEAAEAAGVHKRITCHQFRHACALFLQRQGLSISEIQRHLRHNSPGTTGLYLRGLSASDVADAIAGAWEHA